MACLLPVEALRLSSRSSAKLINPRCYWMPTSAAEAHETRQGILGNVHHKRGYLLLAFIRSASATFGSFIWVPICYYDGHVYYGCADRSPRTSRKDFGHRMGSGRSNYNHIRNGLESAQSKRRFSLSLTNAVYS
jgi:hypothetical protein